MYVYTTLLAICNLHNLMANIYILITAKDTLFLIKFVLILFDNNGNI